MKPICGYEGCEQPENSRIHAYHPERKTSILHHKFQPQPAAQAGEPQKCRAKANSKPVAPVQGTKEQKCVGFKRIQAVGPRLTVKPWLPIPFEIKAI